MSLIGEAPDTINSPWFLILRLDRSNLRCNSDEFASALIEEGIDGVQPGYPFYPTDQPWHQDGVVYGTSRLPWSMTSQATSRDFVLANAHAANVTIVRVDVHEGLKHGEARDLVSAISKIAAYYKSTLLTSSGLPES